MTSDEQIAQLLRLAGPTPHAACDSGGRGTRSRPRRMDWRTSKSSVGAIVVGVDGDGSRHCQAACWWRRGRLFRPIGPSTSHKEIATVQTMTGSLFIESPGAGNRGVAQRGGSLRAGDRIETP